MLALQDEHWPLTWNREACMDEQQISNMPKVYGKIYLLESGGRTTGCWYANKQQHIKYPIEKSILKESQLLMQYANNKMSMINKRETLVTLVQANDPNHYRKDFSIKQYTCYLHSI